MVHVVRRLTPLWAVAVLLSLAIVGTAVVSSGCPIERRGTIMLPAGKLAPAPPLATDEPNLHEVMMFILVDPVPGEFRLRPSPDVEPMFCAGGDNCITIPDFNVAFYRNAEPLDAQTGQVYNGFGKVEGTVPADADYAMVWMTTGMNAQFVFQQDC